MMSSTRPGIAHRVTRRLTAVALAAGVIAAAAGAAVADGGNDDRRPVSAEQAHVSVAGQPASVTSTCFWGVPAGPLDGRNILGPETNVSYWYDRFQLPAGAQIVLHGEFPHARFMSLTSYGTVAGQRGTALGGLSDVDIDPDPDSQNPFRPDASRTARRRSFTVTLSGAVDPGPGNRAPNTFYVGQPGLTGTTQTIELILRVYRPDRNRDMAGGVALPNATLVLADGTTAPGQAACDGVQAQSGADKLDITGMGVPPATYLSLLAAGAAPTHPAEEQMRFERFFNTQYSLAPFYRGTPLEGRIASLPTDIRPGLYPTPANAYIGGYADRSFGPDPDGHNVLVLRGKLPTHPDTFRRNPHTESGTQVRYWSLCNYGSNIANPPLAPVNTDCLFDEQIPTDDDGNYEIVISLTEDRPGNATARCGVAWMDWTTKGDGVVDGNGVPVGHDRLIRLTMRQQLADPTFAEAIDKIVTPGAEEQVMGEYYPHGTYMTAEQFDQLGCRR